ncbi:hypothetical protein DFH07DRAFT_16046 [Mycena maculata]|uniref:Uncharacterized protein n=1 Tax=Mycena maculata TaxID=230809 RepID=A0AAD7IM76_9AGAR|nr:hypothetical protein DFH07DRAFT_16046 [Mycena maculata]
MATIVFLGAPSASEIHCDPSEYHWRTVSSQSALHRQASSQAAANVYPPATLEAASRRISLMYNNVIFDESEEEDPDEKPGFHSLFRLSFKSLFIETTADETFITWPPTPPGDDSDSQEGQSVPSFFNASKSMAQTDAQLESQFETQETQSYDYSDASSIARFPKFHFSLNSLTSLTSLAKSRIKRTKKVSLLLVVLEVDGPDSFYFKKGKDAGKESFVLKMILGDEDGNVCKLTAWREVAQDWGGAGQEIGAKRGDILFLTDVMAAFEPTTTVTLTASPWQKPKLEICYRTMPYTHEDQRLRPDLRLGASDASVRKVAAVVRWFEDMAGLAGAQ